MMQKIRFEYELWCNLCESFAANPFNTDGSSLFLLQTMNRNWSIKLFEESRHKMQQETLGFVPIKTPVPSIVSDAKSMNLLNDFSNAMKALYLDEYRVSDAVHARREAVRSGIEQVVTDSKAFPEGTRVAIFGSSANGFG
jgi:hypothetical protein